MESPSKKEKILRATDLLSILRQVYEDDAMPSMIDEGEADDRIEEIDDAIKNLEEII